MHAHDGSAWPRTALTLALMLSLGLIDSPTHPPEASLALPDEALGANPPQDGKGESGRDTTAVEATACDGECLTALRQRLLDHHRQAAPVWVF